VRLEASTKPHVHKKFEIFWTNIASTMTCPNFKNGPKNGLCPLGVKPLKFCTTYMLCIFFAITHLIFAYACTTKISFTTLFKWHNVLKRGPGRENNEKQAYIFAFEARNTLCIYCIYKK
jgi:hypothetical protein